MLMETEKKNGLLIVRIKEKRLDARIAPLFMDTIRSYVDDGAKKIILNFTITDFIDSSGIGAIVSILKSMGNNGIIAITNPSGPVLQLLEMTQMDNIFSIYTSESAAVKSLSR